MVPIGGIQRAVVEALRYARNAVGRRAGRSTSTWIRRRTEQIQRDWDTWGGTGEAGRPAARRTDRVMEPLLEYIEQVEAERPDDYVTVILPEFVPARWWQHLLHNQRALLIKGALLFRPNTVVTSVPFHLAR